MSTIQAKTLDILISAQIDECNSIELRTDILELLLTRQLDTGVWIRCESSILQLLDDDEITLEQQERLLKLAALLPLDSVRKLVKLKCVEFLQCSEVKMPVTFESRPANLSGPHATPASSFERGKIISAFQRLKFDENLLDKLPNKRDFSLPFISQIFTVAFRAYLKRLLQFPPATIPDNRVGYSFVQLHGDFPGLNLQIGSIANAYLDYVANTHRPPVAFEQQVGWLVSRGDFDSLVIETSAYLQQKEPKLRETAWSLARYNVLFKGDNNFFDVERLPLSTQLIPINQFGKISPSSDDRINQNVISDSEIDHDYFSADIGAAPSPDAAEDSAKPFDDRSSPAIDWSVKGGGFEDDKRVYDTSDAFTSEESATQEMLSESPDTPLIETPDEDLDTSVANVEGDPPRSAYGLVKAPKVVSPDTAFIVTVGLSSARVPGTTGEAMHRPVSSQGPYLLKVRLICDGFEVASDNNADLVQTLYVTAANPYPTQEIPLLARKGDQFSKNRVILAEFSVDGQVIGAAARYISINETSATEEEIQVASGVSVVVDKNQLPADITITIARGNDSAGHRWVFSVESPLNTLDLSPPDDPEALVSNIGDSAEEFAKRLTKQIILKDGKPELPEEIRQAGNKIGNLIPIWVQRKLLKVYDLLKEQPSPPTLLLISAEPYIPWELSTLQFREPGRQFLSAEFSIGRWVLGHTNARTMKLEPPVPPPTELTIDNMTVVSGNYEKTRGWQQLEGAKEEAVYLQDTYSAQPLEAKLNTLLSWFRAGPDVELVHFCVHGKWDSSGLTDGIAMVDNQMLQASVVSQSKFKSKPFVFLNACQVGQSSSVLGQYSGMAEAFLQAGAAAVIAPLWPVDDQAAKEFAKRFYQNLNKLGPGEVVRQEKTNFDRASTSAIHLAYQFFGHPAMRVQFNLVEGRENA